MIHRATFQNFKALRDVTVTFDSRFTVLVGPNGCGKTSVLQGIETISLLSRGVPPEHFSSFLWSQYGIQAESNAPVHVSATATTQSGEFVIGEYGIIKARESTGGRDARESSCYPTFRLVSSDTSSAPLREVSATEAVEFHSAALMNLRAERIALPSSLISLPPRISTDGAGVASRLAYLDRVDRKRFRSISAHLREIVPHISEVQLSFHATNEVVQDGYQFVLTRGGIMPASAASGGTLIVLALLTELLGEAGAKILLVDELEQGLHPKAQMKLIELLNRLLEIIPEVQVVATSHSPYILDQLDPNQVRVMQLDDDGSAIIAPLTDHPDFGRWTGSMSPGEFWGTFYEDWLARKPEPQPAT